MQIRRVLLLFALVLGLSALVASIAPPPDTRDEGAGDQGAGDAPALETPPPASLPARRAGDVHFSVPAASARPKMIQTRRVAAGASIGVEVSVSSPGDVAIEGLGLRQTADPLTPARFDLLARPAGRYRVFFQPLRGRARVVGRLEFAEAASVMPRRRGR